MIHLITILALSAPNAWSASAYNAHGYTQVPGDGDLHDPLAMWRPEVQVPNSFGVGGLIEFAKAPLVQYSYGPDGLEGDPLVDNLLGLNVGGIYAFHRRVAATMTMPIWINSEDINGDSHPGLGDLRVAVPVGILLPDTDGTAQGAMNASGFLLSAVPYFNLPTGSDKLYLGAQGFGGGAVLAAGYGQEAWQVFANLGGEYTPAVEDLLNLNGGTFAKANLGASVRVAKNIAVRGEGTMNMNLTKNEVAFAEAPAEVLLSARMRANKGLNFTVGGAKSVTPGAGAAKYRLFAGVGWAYGKDAAEFKPLEPCELLVTVQDTNGKPIDTASVTLENRVLATDSEGHAKFDNCSPGRADTLSATAPTYKDGKSDPFELKHGPNERVIVLEPQDSQLKIIALNEKGMPAPARVRFLEGPADQGMVELGLDGEETLTLKPGTWKVLVASPIHVPQEATATLDPGEFETIIVRFTADKPINVCSEVVVLRNVNFDFDVDVPREDSLPVLKNIATSLKDCPNVIVEVGGHTDSKGSDAYNIDLSQRRMNSVKKILMEYGVAESRMIAMGYGESKPIASNKTDEGRAQNRRVEFVPLQGKAVVLPPAIVPVNEAAPAPAGSTDKK